jgi:hypothetical protein
MVLGKLTFTDDHFGPPYMGGPAPLAVMLAIAFTLPVTVLDCYLPTLLDYHYAALCV